MAEKKASGIQFDDFVSAIRSDPAQSEPLIMLSGYVGKSDTDGNVRIYPDASLGHWYEAAQDDVVHSRPITDSPLGGSNVWLKGSAQITPGVASVPKPEPKEGEEGEAGAEAAPQVGADTGVFNPLTTIHPTLWTQIGCITQPPGCGPSTIHPTLLTQIYCPGPGTIHPTIWTQIGCSTQAGCIETIACPPHQGFEAQAQQISLPGCVHTGICISQPGCLPPRTIDCPVLSVPGCLPPTHLLGCPRTSTCPPTLQPGCLPTSTCPPQTQLLGCPSTSTCPPTQMLGCPRTSTCPPTQMPGCPATRTCPPTQMLGCPRTSTCPPTLMPGCHTLGFTCTYVGCPPRGYGAEAQHISLPGCIHTGSCLLSHNCPPPPTNMPGCPNTSTCTPGGGYGAEAVHISLPGCIHTGTCLLSHNCPPPPTNMPGCPSTSTCPPPTHMLGCPSTSTCPQTNMPGCPSTSTCPPPTEMLGCPSTSTCPPTHMPGCPSTSTCPPEDISTAATLCTQLGCPRTRGCPPPHISLPGCVLHTAAGCGIVPESRVCTVYGCPETVDTVCTQYGCETRGGTCIETVSGPCLPYTTYCGR